MVWHIILAALATWLSLALLVHAAMFVVGLVRMESWLFHALCKIGFFLVAPVFIPWIVLRRRYRRWRLRLRLARIIDRHLSLMLDMRALSKDEQRAFIERLHSDKDTKQVVMDAMRRVREVQEVAE